MHKRSIAALIMLIHITLSAVAQNYAIQSDILDAYTDSLSRLVSKYESQKTKTDSNLDTDPFLYKLLTNPTYYNSAVHSAFTLKDDESEETKELNSTLMRNYLGSASKYSLSEKSLGNIKRSAPVNVGQSAPDVDVVNLVKVDKPKAEVGQTGPVAQRPNFWKINSNIYFQMSQSYVSSNWYKGGESSNTFLSGLTVTANYDDQKKLEWENKLEIKLGFISSNADTLHKFKTNNDLIRITSKIGYKAVKNWYYTFQGVAENQFFPGYKDNKPTTYSSFMSPLKVNASVGMDFKKSVANKYNISVALLPGSVNYYYVSNKDVNVTQFGIEEGKWHLLKFGSKIQVNSTINFTQDIKWTSYFYVFTSYKNCEGQWENTFDFQINKYLTTKIFLNARYDDAATRAKGFGYFQFLEQLSFGLSYSI